MANLPTNMERHLVRRGSTKFVGQPDVATKVTGSQHELGFRAFDEKSRGKARRVVLAM
jgi:hypothetical protein